MKPTTIHRSLITFFASALLALIPAARAGQVPDLPAVSSAHSDDLLYIINVHDLTDGPNGSGRKITIGSVMSSIPLASGQILIGGTNAFAAPVTLAGDATLAASGTLTFSSVSTSGTYSLGGNGSIAIDVKGRVLIINPPTNVITSGSSAVGGLVLSGSGSLMTLSGTPGFAIASGSSTVSGSSINSGSAANAGQLGGVGPSGYVTPGGNTAFTGSNSMPSVTIIANSGTFVISGSAGHVTVNGVPVPSSVNPTFNGTLTIASGSGSTALASSGTGAAASLFVNGAAIGGGGSGIAVTSGTGNGTYFYDLSGTNNLIDLTGTGANAGAGMSFDSGTNATFSNARGTVQMGGVVQQGFGIPAPFQSTGISGEYCIGSFVGTPNGMGGGSGGNNEFVAFFNTSVGSKWLFTLGGDGGFGFQTALNGNVPLTNWATGDVYINSPGDFPASDDGNALQVNGNIETIGGQLSINDDTTTPTNSITPAGYSHCQIGGADAWLPYYR